MPSTAEQRAKRAAYMRIWTAKNADRVKQQRVDRLKSMKLHDPDRYKAFREKCNLNNTAYAETHREFLQEKWLKRHKETYTPEYGAMVRKRYGVKYSTQVSMKSARKRAAEKGMPFDLTPEWYEQEFAKGCAVTGLPLDPNGSKTPFTAHVDRVVPDLGYVQSNCRLVCACYNLAKKHWKDEDVLKMARALVAKNPSN